MCQGAEDAPINAMQTLLLGLFSMVTMHRRSGDKTAGYFEKAIDVLANPEQDVLIYDVESWALWKGVWDTFERDGVPRTDDLNVMQR